MRDDMTLSFGFTEDEILEALVDYVNKSKCFSLQKELCKVRTGEGEEMLSLIQSTNTISATKYFMQDPA